MTCCRRSAPSPGPVWATSRGCPRTERASSSLLPEDGDGAEVAVVLADERERGHGDPSGGAVEAGDPHLLVGRSPTFERLHERELVRRNRVPRLVARCEDRGPLRRRHRAGLLVAPAEQLLRRL